MNTIKRCLLSPWTIIAAVILSLVVGYYCPAFSLKVDPFGQFFLNLLKMCVIPIIITAIPSGFAKLLMQKIHPRALLKIFLLFIALLLITSLISLVIAKFSAVGVLNSTDRSEFGRLLLSADADTSPINHHAGTHLSSLLHYFANDNIFVAFMNNNMPAILLFSILFGLSLGFVCTKSGEDVVSVLQGIFSALLNLINGLIYFLPIGLFCVIAPEVAKTGFSLFGMAAKLIGVVYGSSIVLFIIALFVLSKLLNSPVWKVLRNFREMFIVAFASSSSYAAFPFALKALEQRYQLNQDRVNLFFPITIALSPVGGVILAVIATVFSANLFNIPMGLAEYTIVLFGAIFVAIAIGGVPAVIGFNMLAITFTPLNIPLGPTLLLLIALSNIIDPIVTLANISTTTAQVTYLVKSMEKKKVAAD